MDPTLIIIAVASSSALVAILVTLPLTWLFVARRARRNAEALLTRATQAETLLEAERAARAEQAAAQQMTEQQLREAFSSLSSDVLQQTNQQFLQLAQERLERQQQTNEQFLQLAQERIERQQAAARSDLSSLVNPLETALKEQRASLDQIEQARRESYGNIQTLIKLMGEDQQQLQSETRNLVNALRQPQVRGRWGELQLQRVVELAGMSQHCDFCQQRTTDGEDGARLRPDLQVMLPNKRQIVVDSKVPFSAYLDALEAGDDETRLARLKDHARQLRRHIDELARKGYHTQLDGAHEFVILFIPGEVFYSVALEHDTELLEYALSKHVMLTTPTTLIALLKAVALGWREARLAEDAHKIKEEGDKIYKRIRTLVEHIEQVGKSLGKSVTAYNAAVGSLETNLLSSAQRMHALQIGAAPIAAPTTVDLVPRAFAKPELLGASEDGMSGA